MIILIKTAKLADASVTTAKIADANVTRGKLAVGAGYGLSNRDFALFSLAVSSSGTCSINVFDNSGSGTFTATAIIGSTTTNPTLTIYLAINGTLMNGQSGHRPIIFTDINGSSGSAIDSYFMLIKPAFDSGTYGTWNGTFIAQAFNGASGSLARSFFFLIGVSY